MTRKKATVTPIRPVPPPFQLTQETRRNMAPPRTLPGATAGQIWTAVAKARRDRGDFAGAKQARFNAKACGYAVSLNARARRRRAS